MWASKRFSFESVGVKGSYTIPQIPSIDMKSVAVYDEKQKRIVLPSGEVRTSLLLTSEFDHGSYGTIREAIRGAIYVLLKQPRTPDSNLLQEAILQHLSHYVLETEGIPWAVPKVYDIFRSGSETWFSMERIYGYSIPDWFADPSKGDLDAMLLIAQIALILATLEKALHLDHRDLKMSNLMIKPEVCTLKVTLGDTTWTLQSPFQVIVLDFGFACLGSEALRGKPLVNLGDGVLPPMDPCPKEGRDMFHCLISLLGLPIFRSRLTQKTHDMVDKWLSLGTKSYGTLARRWSEGNWSYLVSSQPTFAIPNCCPLRILSDLVPELRGRLTNRS